MPVLDLSGNRDQGGVYGVGLYRFWLLSFVIQLIQPFWILQMMTGTYLQLQDRLPARCPETVSRQTYLSLITINKLREL
jgi:hypothetical protein